jgi:hypothetical protein
MTSAGSPLVVVATSLARATGECAAKAIALPTRGQ